MENFEVKEQGNNANTLLSADACPHKKVLLLRFLKQITYQQ